MTTRAQRQAVARQRNHVYALVDPAIQRALDKLAQRVAERLTRTVTAAAAPFSIDDLAIVNTIWPELVDEEVMPTIGEAFTYGARRTAKQLSGRVTAAFARYGTENVLAVVNRASEAFLASARTNILGIGNTVQATARTQLLEAFGLGESIPEMVDRLMGAISDLSEPMATVAARTSAIGAANAGSVAKVRSLGEEAIPTRTWLATGDARTRDSHWEANGQTVGINEPFSVGDDLLDFPGDPNGSAAETASCRCSVTYDEVTSNLLTQQSDIVARADAEALAAAAGETHSGSMIALVPSEADAARLALDGWETPEEMHVTLAFLGDAAQWDEASRSVLYGLCADLSAGTQPMEAKAFGVGVFNADGDEPCAIYNVGDTDLEATPLKDVHGRLMADLDDYNMDVPPQHSPWAAHSAGAYCTTDEAPAILADMTTRLGPITLDRLRFAMAEEIIDFTLGTDAPPVTGEPPSVTEQASGGIIDAGEDAHMGTISLNPTEPIRLTAAAEDMPTGAPQASEEWHAVLAPEGVESGDAPRREFAPDSLIWRELPLPFEWQPTDLPEHEGAVVVGAITRIERQGGVIHGWGHFLRDIPEIADAVNAAVGYVTDGANRGVSVVVDDADDADIELVWPVPDPNEPPEEQAEDILFGMPEKVIFHAARICKATLVSIPAFPEAFIELLGSTSLPPADMVAPAMSAEVIEEAGAIIAAAYTVTIPDCPPPEWFDQPPRELLRHGALTVTDEGRIYGLLAPGGVAHIGRADRVMAPTRTVDYSKFMGGETPCADGTRVVTGNLTMGCGHASLALDGPGSADHYDNTCSLFGTVRVGEIGDDVWVAGALLGESLAHERGFGRATADMVRRAMACRLSGDWRARRDGKPGRELTAALLVPVPGFGKAREQATTRLHSEEGQLELVASAVPVRFEHHEDTPRASVKMPQSAADRVARSVGLDRQSRAARLAERVRGGQ